MFQTTNQHDVFFRTTIHQHARTSYHYSPDFPFETSCHSLCGECYAGYLQVGMGMREVCADLRGIKRLVGNPQKKQDNGK